MTYPIKSPKKLIEVALPLDAINAAAAREKSIRHGHPSTLHLWWARRPLAAARAVIFAQLVNDPGFQRGGGFQYGMEKKKAAAERKRLFGILEELVKWENTTNKEVLESARAEIRRSWREVCELNKDHPQAKELFDPEKMPGLHDPFAGGGTIPLEAQRLGLEAFASDLNPVAVLINKAMIEIPSRLYGLPSVHPSANGLLGGHGISGLAEDVRKYGEWLRDEASTVLGHLYPKVVVSASLAKLRADLSGLGGKELTVIGWLWARTVRSPNPAFAHAAVPLMSSYVLASKKGTEFHLHPIVHGGTYRFDVRPGPAPQDSRDGTKASGRGAAFRCILSDAPISAEYIRSEGMAGRIGCRMVAIVASSPAGRVYLPASTTDESVANSASPSWAPENPFFQQALGFRVGNYGMSRWSDLFTLRQLTLLSTIAELVPQARDRVLSDSKRLVASGRMSSATAAAYADAIALYLSFAVSRMADRHSALCRWDPNPSGYAPKIANTFGRQALSMVWDFVEGNPFSESSGNLLDATGWISKVIETAIVDNGIGHAQQADAQTQSISENRVVSTDPPYYDNIGYADLSDFFYVWLRRSAQSIFPDLFTTLAAPKNEELVATPHRHGGREGAERFFLAGMSAAMKRIAELTHPAIPITIFYAFKQAETKNDGGTSSTGWETFLESVVAAGFSLTGTWPMRTELSNRMRGAESNALASSVVLVGRRRPENAVSISRREFARELNQTLPIALDEMTRGADDELSPVAPVDLSQAIIGPGMAVFSKYAAVLEADGSPMSVKTALQLINRFLAEDDFDHDTQFCLHWFDQYGWSDGAYGEADVLARAKSTSVSGLAEAGVLLSRGGKVRLLRPNEYPSDWDPKKDSRMPIWEALHQLIRSLREQGESGAGQLLAAVKAKSEAIRQLAYRLYTLCERRGWADDARAYNELVTSWSGVESAAGEVPEKDEQLKLFGGEA